MESIFLHLVNMSITAGWLVLAVLVLRLIFRRAPKWIHCLLWVLVALRLIFPVSVESVLSLIPSAETVPVDTFLYETPSIHSGLPVVDNTVNPIISDSFAPQPMNSVNPMQVVSIVASYLWVLGMVAMAVYALVTTLRLWWRVRESVTLRDNIRLCDRIATPFILGLFRPRIYLPTTLTEEDTQCVVAHEQAHLRRRDHWWKPLGFLLLTVYWFNPLLWVGYVLLCRDIEAACDQKVIRDMDVAQRKAYSETLLACSAPRHLITACPLAFGETGVKSRIKSVLNYKKPAFWIIIAAVVATVVAAVCLLTNPKTDVAEDLDAYLSQVILEQNHSEHTGDAFATEAHTVFGTEKQDGNTVVYGLVLYEEYVRTEKGDLEVQGGSHIPTVITVEEKDGTYSLVEYWIPRDGDLYAPDIRDKYPARYQGQAFDLNGYYNGHKEKTLAAARAHFALAELPDESEYVTYAYVGPPSAHLSLQREGNQAAFSPHILSSWMALGTYERNEGTLTFTAENIKLVFRVDGDSLIFDKSASTFDAEQITFGGVEMEDGARFTKTESDSSASAEGEFSGWKGDTTRFGSWIFIQENWFDDSIGIAPAKAIHSVEELKALMKKHNATLISTYDSAYFEENVLLLVPYSDGSSSVDPVVVDVRYGDQPNSLQVLLDVYTPLAVDTGIGYWMIATSVDREAVADITSYDAVVRGCVPTNHYVARYEYDPAWSDIKTTPEVWREFLKYEEEEVELNRILYHLNWGEVSGKADHCTFLGTFNHNGITYYVSSDYKYICTEVQEAYLSEEDSDFFRKLFQPRDVTTYQPPYRTQLGATLPNTNKDQPRRNCWHTMIEPISRPAAASLTGGYTLDKDTVNQLKDIVDELDWIGEPEDQHAGFLCSAYFSFDGSSRYYVFMNTTKGSFITGKTGRYAMLNKEQCKIMERLMSGGETTDSTSTTTTTVFSTIPTVNGWMRELSTDFVTKVRVQRPVDAGSTGGSVNGRVIRNIKELKAAKLDALTPYDSAESLPLASYDDAYFKNNALVVAYVTMASGAYRVSVDRLTVKVEENQLIVGCVYDHPNTTLSGDMAYWCVLIGVKKSDVESVTRVLGTCRQNESAFKSTTSTKSTTKKTTATSKPTVTTKPTATTKKPTSTKSTTTTTKKTTAKTNISPEKSVEVTVADKVRVWWYESKLNSIIVRTIKERNNIEEDPQIPDEGKAILSLSRYNMDFYRKNALVMAPIVLSSGSYRLEVEAVTVRDDTLTVHYSKIGDGDTDDIGIWYVWLEVKSADIEGVTKITSVDTGKTRTLRQPKLNAKELAALDTNLEFWITENVDDVDFSGYTFNPGWMGADEYFGTGYVPENGEEPEYCVKYLVSSYPDYSDHSQHITYITITDPSIHFYGVSLKSSNAEFVQMLEKQGYVVKTVSDATNYVSMKKGNITIWRNGGSIHISAEVTNREGILF